MPAAGAAAPARRARARCPPQQAWWGAAPRAGRCRRLQTHTQARAQPPAAAAAGGCGGERLWQAGGGGWALAAARGAPPVIALVDGTNVAMRARRGPPGDGRGQAGRFAEWLAFIAGATRAAALLVAFDNKGSSGANARAAAFPGYNAARYGRAAAAAAAATATAAATVGGGGGGSRGGSGQGVLLPGWAHLDGAVREAGAIPVHAAAGCAPCGARRAAGARLHAAPSLAPRRSGVRQACHAYARARVQVRGR